MNKIHTLPKVSVEYTAAGSRYAIDAIDTRTGAVVNRATAQSYVVAHLFADWLESGIGEHPPLELYLKQQKAVAALRDHVALALSALNLINLVLARVTRTGRTTLGDIVEIASGFRYDAGNNASLNYVRIDSEPWPGDLELYVHTSLDDDIGPQTFHKSAIVHANKTSELVDTLLDLRDRVRSQYLERMTVYNCLSVGLDSIEILWSNRKALLEQLARLETYIPHINKK